jgi:hypothetical protein
MIALRTEKLTAYQEDDNVEKGAFKPIFAAAPDLGSGAFLNFHPWIQDPVLI